MERHRRAAQQKRAEKSSLAQRMVQDVDLVRMAKIGFAQIDEGAMISLDELKERLGDL